MKSANEAYGTESTLNNKILLKSFAKEWKLALTCPIIMVPKKEEHISALPLQITL
jgi:hypothetical protein